MDYKTAMKEIAAGRFRPVYICYGTESYLQQAFISRLTSCLLDADSLEFGLSKFDLSETSVDMVLDDAETLPFMVPRKLVLARDARFLTGAKDQGKAEHRLDRLQEYLQAPPEHTVVVFTVDAEKLDERKKVVKLLKQSDLLLPCQPFAAGELLQWVRRQAEDRNVSFADGAAEHLLLYTGADLQQISVEVEKLSLYAGSAGRITADMIAELVVRSTEQNVFMLVEELVHLRVDKAMQLFHELIKMKEEPIKISILLARQFRILTQVKYLSRQGFSQQQMASRLGLHPYAVKLAAGQADLFPPQRLAQVLSGLAELDHRMKTGRVDKVLGLELFILSLGQEAAG